MKLILCLYGPKEFCQLSSEAGEGTEFIFALYYDTAQDLCNPFIYKGQGGNENRFYNERECIRNCSSNAENVYPIDGKVILNISISIWLLNFCLGTLEQAVTNKVIRTIIVTLLSVKL